MIYIIFQILIYLLSKYFYHRLSGGYSLFETKQTIIYEIIIVIVLGLINELNKPKLYQLKFKYVFAPFIKNIFLILFSIFIIDKYNNNTNILFYFLYLVTFLTFNFLLIKKLLYRQKNIQFNNEISKYNQVELEPDKNLVLGEIKKNIKETLINYTDNIIRSINEFLTNKDDSAVGIINNNKCLDNKNFDIIIIDKQLNLFNDINAILSSLYGKLKNHGILILFYEELNDFENKIYKTNFILLRFLLFLYYYIFLRILPKIPYLNKINNIIKIKYKVLSKAETWGRLTFNGFDIIKEIKNNNFTYVIAQKKIESSKNPNPSFYPIIRLNRVGLNGKIIKIHKLRSMYPYSEFIQKKVFEQQNLNNIGKFENDFRISKHGKYFRKYWLDEIPQFYDWLRGEIKLVGIRAMSQHFFSLYPNDYKEKYLKIKPGIISPIFDENTNGFDDIVKIEEKYLNAYLKNPFLTDVKYFFKTIKQIFKGIRSK